MAWYWIVCIVLGYLLLGAVIGEIWDNVDYCGEDFKLAILVAWPIILAIVLVFGSIAVIQGIGEFIVNAVGARIEGIGDFIYIQRQKRRQKKAQKALCPKNKKGCSKGEIDDIDYDRRKR